MAEQTLVPTLHHLDKSQSHRVLFALEELAAANGTKYNLKNYTREDGIAPASLKEVFVLGKSPILTVEADGVPSKTIFQHPAYPGTLTESRLCLKFLSDNFGHGLWEPQEGPDHQQDVFFQEFANATAAAKITMAFIFIIIPARSPFGIRSVLRLIFSPVVSHFMNDIKPIFQFMEGTLSEERPWFAGRKMGLSDINMSWCMDVAVQCKILDGANYPRLEKWHDMITSRPAYQTALEKGGDYDLRP